MKKFPTLIEELDAESKNERRIYSRIFRFSVVKRECMKKFSTLIEELDAESKNESVAVQRIWPHAKRLMYVTAHNECYVRSEFDYGSLRKI